MVDQAEIVLIYLTVMMISIILHTYLKRSQKRRLIMAR